MYKEDILKEHLEVINGHIYRKSTGKPYSYGNHDKGYKVIYLKRKKLYVHRVLWVLTYGDIPDGYMVDHIDGDKANNELSNLRLATNSQNLMNRVGWKQDGLPKGVYKYKTGFTCRVTKDGKHHTKCCTTLEEATEWVKEKRRELHGEFSCD